MCQYTEVYLYTIRNLTSSNTRWETAQNVELQTHNLFEL